jgi:nitrate/nitrite transporter NarK
MSQSATMTSAPGVKSDIETSTIRAISVRLIPFLVLAYFFSYLDRVNLGFAALTMNADLKFSPLVFAWGAGIFCIFAVFWTLPTAWLSGTAAAGAIALINSIGNLAGFGGPYLIGWIKDSTGSTANGLLALAVLPLIGALLVFLGGHESKVEFEGAGQEVK